MKRSILQKRLLAVLNLFFVTSILFSCALPAWPATQPQAQPTPATAQDILPPALVEVSPLDGGLLGVNDPITFYFSQPMERVSVEAALFGLPPGPLAWSDDSTLTFTPNPPLAAGSEITIAILTSALSANGLALTEPITLAFHTSPLLRAVNFLPPPDSQDISPTAAVAVTFNQPVVALGAGDSSTGVESALPDALVLDPPVEGRGEWLSTSTYVFYPEPALGGGETYTARLNTELVSTTGAPLATDEGSLAWSFNTALPRLVSTEPSNTQSLVLDPEIKLTFNQPMHTASVEGSFSFRGATGGVPGVFTWDEEQTVMNFKPSSLLDRGATYTLSITTQAAALGGEPLPLEHQFQYTTYSDFSLAGSDPLEGGVKSDSSVRVLFSAPLKDSQDLEEWVSLEPEIPNLNISVSDSTLNINGYYAPETDYTLILSPALVDRWGQSLDQAFTLHFRTPPARPGLSIPSWSHSFFVRPDEAALQANAVNIQDVEVSVAPLSLADFRSLSGSSGYENLQSFAPQNPNLYSDTYELAPSRNEVISLPLASEGDGLSPGLYYVSVDSPQLNQAMGATGGDFEISARAAGQARKVYLVVSSDINLTFKNGATDALVWATDLRTNIAVTNAPMKIYDEEGNLLASGQTDRQGLWQADLPPMRYDSTLYVVSGEPGEENFGLALSSWNTGLSPWEFGISYRQQPPEPKTYLYSDRPIYRPGQTVYFRGVVRQAFDGRYELPEFPSITLDLADWEGRILQTFDLPLSPYGAFNGQFQLSTQAEPGWYSLNNSELGAYLYFDVAEYRKPEIELEVAFEAGQAKTGEPLKAASKALYYFGAPAGDVAVEWNLYERTDWFDLPGYQTGLVEDGWLSPFWAGEGDFGLSLKSGQARTAPDGSLSLEEALKDIPASESPRTLTLEMTARDESGYPVSAHAEIYLHPADFYIGLRPDQWVGQSGVALGFEVLTADWEKQASPSRELLAEFKRVEWQRKDPPTELPYAFPTFEPVYTLAGSSALTTGLDGIARLSFTPSQAGAYLLDVSSQGSLARTQALVWVGGGQNAAWPDLANDLLRLSPDQPTYQPGQTAKVFIPNPFGKRVPALVTVERGKVWKAETIMLGDTGSIYSLPLTEAEAPNVYLSATLLAPPGASPLDNRFRQGYTMIKVEPLAQQLSVELTAEPEVNEPRGEMLLHLLVTDHAGEPVQGEFSLSMVDKAVLALADSNATDILSAFYGEQALGVNTGLSLAAYSGRFVFLPPGLGGGGDGGLAVVREQFPDTAYWNPTFVTDANGMGQVKLTLPDNLTTWFLEARGLTLDTRVGQAQTEVVTTKPLLVRPVTPRFLVAGDHVELAAILHNNTGNNLQATARLEGSGFTLDDPGQAEQIVNLSANSRARVTWWGVAGGATEADLTFSVTSNHSRSVFQDAARPASGTLPIRAYVAPQSFVTAGMLADAGARQETIYLPRTFSPAGGGLEVEMAPSLAATLLNGLEALPSPSCACNSQEVLSYLLPNLETYRAFQASGMESPDLQARFDQSLRESLDALVSNQNDDGGWGWLRESRSDSYISSYVLFGLGRARLAGLQLPDETFEKAHVYLQETLPDSAVLASLQPWELDRLAFSIFALQQSGGLPDSGMLERLFEQRDRISPWAQALLALEFKSVSPDDSRARDLLANLESTAIRTASSANWESESGGWRNPGSPLYTTAVVVYALAQDNPASPVLIEAVRYLVANRDVRGVWGSMHESAWVILALTEAMKGFGELQADFEFAASLNGAPLASGDVSGTDLLTPVKAEVPLAFLAPDAPNALTISREAGLGRLYYRATLLLERPVETAQPLNRGMHLHRGYYDAACAENCSPLSEFQLASSSRLVVQLTLTLPKDAYYLTLEDYIPAGTEILNQSLKTSQQGLDAAQIQAVYDPKRPFESGWGWWYFNQPQIRDDRIQWSADYLPAGTYELSYTLIPNLAGDFRVLPARAWLSFFPDVQGTSAGTVFKIAP